jgi:hypothetical protein
MCREAHIVAELGVRRHLGTTFFSRPRFRVLHEFASDTGFSKFRFHEPPFQISDMVRLAILDEWADAGLEKTDKAAGSVFGNQDKL